MEASPTDHEEVAMEIGEKDWIDTRDVAMFSRREHPRTKSTKSLKSILIPRSKFNTKIFLQLHVSSLRLMLLMIPLYLLMKLVLNFSSL